MAHAALSFFGCKLWRHFRLFFGRNESFSARVDESIESTLEICQEDGRSIVICYVTYFVFVWILTY